MKRQESIMLRYIYTFLFLFFITPFFGQELMKIDSLEEQADYYHSEDSLAEWIVVQKKLLNEKCKNVDCKIKSYSWIIENKWRVGKNKKENSQITSLYVTKGYYLDLQGQYLKAKTSYETVLNDPKLSSSKDEYYINNYVHRDLGNIYTRLGEIEKAIISLQLFLKSTDSPISKAEAYSDLGKAYETKGNLSTALNFYQKGLKIPNLPEETRGLLYSSLLLSYYDAEDYEKVIINGEKALKFLEKKDYNEIINGKRKLKFLQEKGEITKSWIMGIYAIMGLSYAQLNEKQASKSAFEYGAQYQKITDNSTINREVAKFYTNQGEALLRLNEPSNAMLFFQKALNAVLPSFKEKDIARNPDEALFYPENTIIEALYGKMQAFIAQYQIDQSSKNVDQALNCYELALKAEFDLRQTYQFEAAQLASVGKTRKHSELILKVLYQVYQKTGKEKYAKKAFGITEMTKASVLQERLSKIYAQANFLPQKLRDQDDAFQKKRNEQYQRLVAEPQNSTNIYKKINEINIDYNVFLKQLEADFPKYAQSKMIMPTLTISAIQTQLLKNKKTAFIEYYWGETAQFAFVLTQNGVLQFKQINTANQPNFEAFYKQLHEVDKTEIGFQIFTKEALKIHENYVKILGLSKDIQQLIIVPDGKLYRLPFATLIHEIPKVKAGRYDKLPYLGLKYRLSYSYSAAVLLELKKQQHTNQDSFLGIAPSFKGKKTPIAVRSGLSDLKHNKQEVIEAGNFFARSTILLEKNNTTKKRFLEESGNYSILHLGTHATAYDTILQQSAIYFSDSALLLQDIYTLPIDAQLVVLSACQTGLGELYAGEGVMSLARAFMYQGCPSVISSLWNVNDESAAKIMTLFYEHLGQNLSKDEALFLARKTYLAQASSTESHPFYWSTFVLIGDETALNGAHSTYIWWGLIGLLALLIVIYFFRKE